MDARALVSYFDYFPDGRNLVAEELLDKHILPHLSYRTLLRFGATNKKMHRLTGKVNIYRRTELLDQTIGDVELVDTLETIRSYYKVPEYHPTSIDFDHQVYQRKVGDLIDDCLPGGKLVWASWLWLWGYRSEEGAIAHPQEVADLSQKIADLSQKVADLSIGEFVKVILYLQRRNDKRYIDVDMLCYAFLTSSVYKIYYEDKKDFFTLNQNKEKNAEDDVQTTHRQQIWAAIKEENDLSELMKKLFEWKKIGLLDKKEKYLREKLKGFAPDLSGDDWRISLPDSLHPDCLISLVQLIKSLWDDKAYFEKRSQLIQQVYKDSTRPKTSIVVWAVYRTVSFALLIAFVSWVIMSLLPVLVTFLLSIAPIVIVNIFLGVSIFYGIPVLVGVASGMVAWFKGFPLPSFLAFLDFGPGPLKPVVKERDRAKLCNVADAAKQISDDLYYSTVSDLTIPKNIDPNFSEQLEDTLAELKRALSKPGDALLQKSVFDHTRILIQEALLPFAGKKPEELTPEMIAKAKQAVETYRQTVLKLSTGQTWLVAALAFAGAVLGMVIGFAAGFAVGAAIGGGVGSVVPVVGNVIGALSVGTIVGVKAAIAAAGTGTVIGASVGTMLAGMSSGAVASKLTKFGIFKHATISKEESAFANTVDSFVEHEKIRAATARKRTGIR